MNNMNITFGGYNNSLNFAFGIQGLPNDFDVLNNPYFQLVGLEGFNKNDQLTFQETYELEICHNDFYNNVLSDLIQAFYL